MKAFIRLICNLSAEMCVSKNCHFANYYFSKRLRELYALVARQQR